MKKVLALLTIVITLLSFYSCDLIAPDRNQNNNQNQDQNQNQNQNQDSNQDQSQKQKAKYTVDFFIENVSANEELGYISKYLKLSGYEGDQVNVKEDILPLLPSGFYIDEESSVLSGTIKADGSLKLSVNLKVDYSSVDYGFKSENEFIKYVATVLGSSELDGVQSDIYASHGYALSATRENSDGGMQIDFGSLAVSDYEKIVLRARISESQSYKILVNQSIELGVLDSEDYCIYDLKPLLDKAGVETISSIGFYDSNTDSGSVYVDAIVFINDETAGVADPSFLVTRDSGSAYISDFNDPAIMALVEKIAVDYRGNAVNGECNVSYGIEESVQAHYGFTYQGIKLEVSELSGFKYNLPESFDLTGANEIVIRFTSENWHGGNMSSFFHFTSGDQIKNIINYCKIYFENGQSVSGNYYTTSTGTLYKQNYRRCTLVLDVDAFVKAAGITSIDGIIFCSTKTSDNDTHVLDEIYYTFDCEEQGIPNTEFASGKMTSQGYILSDTAHGLMITGKSWSYAEYVLDNAILGADINTVTVRYKESDTEQALIKFMSGTKEIFVNLTKANEGNAGVISKVVDEYGFTIITLDFKLIPSNDWSISDRSTMDLTEIRIGSSHSLGTPIFDYVAYNK